MKNDQFHVPFIKSLVFIAVVTIVSMSFVHYFISPQFFSHENTSVFTSSQSQISPESPQ